MVAETKIMMTITTPNFATKQATEHLFGCVRFVFGLVENGRWLLGNLDLPMTLPSKVTIFPFPFHPFPSHHLLYTHILVQWLL